MDAGNIRALSGDCSLSGYPDKKCAVCTLCRVWHSWGCDAVWNVVPGMDGDRRGFGRMDSGNPSSFARALKRAGVRGGGRLVFPRLFLLLKRLGERGVVIWRSFPLRDCLPWNLGMGNLSRNLCEKTASGVSSVSRTRLAGDTISFLDCGKRPASMSVEAACVMAIVILALGTMFRGAWGLKSRVAGTMTAHEAMEVVRHEPDVSLREGERLFGAGGLSIRLSERADTILVKGSGISWTCEISTERFCPQDFLRMVTLLERTKEQENGDSL